MINIIKSIKNVSSRVEKEQILFSAFLDGYYDFFTGLLLAYDFYSDFGVSKVAEIAEDDDIDGDFSFNEFLSLTKKLQSKTLSEQEAKEIINDAALRCHTETWNLFYRKILLKKMDLGIQVNTINKILYKCLPTNPIAEKFIIPIFKVQLAEDGEDTKHHKKIKGHKIIDEFIDGDRLITVFDKQNNTFQIYSKTGNIVDDIEIKKSLDVIINRLPVSLVFDGVVKNDKYALFDIIPVNDFKISFSKKTQLERRIVLSIIQETGIFSNIDNIYVVPYIEVDLDTNEGKQKLKEYTEQIFVDGIGNIMIKDPYSQYEGKKSTSWIKKKIGKQHV